MWQHILIITGGIEINKYNDLLGFHIKDKL